MDNEPYFAPSINTLAEVKALTLREEAKLLAQADPSEVCQLVAGLPGGNSMEGWPGTGGSSCLSH